MKYRYLFEGEITKDGWSICAICGERFGMYFNKELICDECEAYLNRPEEIHDCRKCIYYTPKNYYTCSKNYEMAENLRICKDFKKPQPIQLELFK